MFLLSLFLKPWEQMMYVCSNLPPSTNIFLFLVWQPASNRYYYFVETENTAAYGSLESQNYSATLWWLLSLKSPSQVPHVCSGLESLLSNICSSGFAVHFGGWFCCIKTISVGLHGLPGSVQNYTRLAQRLLSLKSLVTKCMFFLALSAPRSYIRFFCCCCLLLLATLPTSKTTTSVLNGLYAFEIAK